MKTRTCLFGIGTLLLAMAGSPSAATGVGDDDGPSLFVYELAPLALPKSPVPFEVWIPIDGKPRLAKLEPFSVRAEGFRLFAVAGKAKPIQLQSDPRTLRGAIPELPGSLLAGSLLDDGLHLTVSLADARRFWLEPAEPFVVDAIPGLHVVYETGGGAPAGGACPPSGGPPPPAGGTGTISSGLASVSGGWGVPLKVCELACDADVEYFLQNGANTLEAADRIELLVNVVNVQFERQVDVTHRIAHTIIRLAEPDPYTTTATRALVDEVASEWFGNLASTLEFDLPMLFSGKVATASCDGVIYAGYAPDDVCDGGHNVCHLAPRDTLRNETHLIAHELGHNWGACHCNDSACFGETICTTTMATPTNGSMAFGPETRATIRAMSESACCLDPTLPNDDCGNALPLAPGTWYFSNDGATTDGHIAPTGPGGSGQDVWFTYRPSLAGTVFVDTHGSSFDTVLSLHTGCPGNDTTKLVVNDDHSVGVLTSAVAYAASAGETILIRVAGYGGAVGDIRLNIAGPAAEALEYDRCGRALHVGPGEYFGTTAGAVADGVHTAQSNAGSESVWFRFRASEAGPLHLDTTGSAIPTELSVHTGCPGTVTNEIGSAAGPPELGASFSVGLAANEEVFIRVSRNGLGLPGPFRLGVTGMSSATDECWGAPVLESGYHSGTLVGMSSSAPTSPCGGGFPTRDAWFRFVAPRDGTMIASTCGTNDLPRVDGGLKTVVSLYSGCPPMAANLLACDSGLTPNPVNFWCVDADSGELWDAAAGMPVFQGQEVLVRVGTIVPGRQGPFRLQLGMLPENDDDADAIPIGIGTVEGSTLFSTRDGSSTLPIANAAGDVWYRYESGDCAGVLTARTCGSFALDGTRTELSVHSAAPGTAANELANGAFSPASPDCADSADSSVAVAIGANQTVWIRVTNAPIGGELRQGAFRLELHFDTGAPGPLQNGTFNDGSGAPWCTLSPGGAGWVDFSDLAAEVHADTGFGSAPRATWIEQRVAVPAGAARLNFAWTLATDALAGEDAAWFDVVDPQSGASVLGGQQVLATTSQAGWDVRLATFQGNGDYLLRFGVTTGATPSVAVASFDNIVLH